MGASSSNFKEESPPADFVVPVIERVDIHEVRRSSTLRRTGGDLDPWASTASAPTRSILRSKNHSLHPPLGEEQSKLVANYDSDTRSVSSRSSSQSCRSGQSVDSRRSGKSLKEETKREVLDQLAARIKGLEKTQDELKKKIDYQEAVIRCVHAGFAEKNNALKVRKNLREEEAARVREILELQEARKETLLGSKEYAYCKIQKLRKQ